MTFISNLFQGKVALVTGGTSGIGAASALHLAQLGAKVLAVGLQAHGQHAPQHANIQQHELDVTNATDLESLIGSLSQLDLLINCVGISRHEAEHKIDSFEQVLAINLTSVMRASVASRPLLAKQKGSIVNIASMYSFFGSGIRPAYAASKGGITQLTASLAQAYADDSIRVNAVAPGWIITPLSHGLMADEKASADIIKRTPMQRWGKAEEVAHAISFLCSPAASFVTGIVLPVDGGYLTV